MKKILLFIAMLFIFNGLQAQITLTIKINNVKSNKGLLHIGLYNKERDFLKKGTEFLSAKVKVENKTGTVVFNDLPKGKYAFAVYHDENQNDKCDQNFLGIPTESYAFSNNVKPKFSAPTYNQTAFSLQKSEAMEVELLQF